MGAPRWFTLRYGSFSRALLLKLVAAGPEHSGIAVHDGDLAIKMGRSFSGRAPRASVAGARPLADTVFSRGVHGWRGDWLVNGAGDGLVEVLLRSADAAHVCGFPVRVRRLRLSVDDPDGLVERCSVEGGLG